MAQVIKYPIQITYTQEVHMPRGAIILSAALELRPQQETLVVCALVDDANPDEPRTVRLDGTTSPSEGLYTETGELAGGFKFLGTVTMANGFSMFHIFAK